MKKRTKTVPAPLKKGFLFGLGVLIAGGIVFAVASVDSIPPKATGDKVTIDEFNSIVDTLKNVYNDGTNIGIGTNDPTAMLDVAGTIKGLNNFSISYPTTGVYGGSGDNSRVDVDSLHTNGLGSGQMFIEGKAMDANSSIMIGSGLAGGQSAQDVYLGDNNELVVDTSAGNVGIGTNAPVHKLDVAGRVNSSGGYRVDDVDIIGHDGDNVYMNVRVLRNLSTDYDDGMFINYNSSGGTAADLRFYANGNTERMRIDAGTGNVGIGTLNPSEKLEVSGSVKATSFVYPSDERLKENIQVLDNSLDKINQLEGVSFDWKESGERSIGLIAQNVEKVFPELVQTSETTGMKSVGYGNLVAPLIEAVKAQQVQISTLKKEIQELKLVIK